MTQIKHYIHILLPLGTSILFAGSFVAAKYATMELGPLTTSMLRYIVAWLFLTLLVFSNRKLSLRVHLPDIPFLIILGLTGIVGYHYFFFMALRYTAVANTSIINALSPIVIGLLAAIFIKERLRIVNYEGVLLSASGVILLICRGNFINLIGLKTNWGDILMIFSVLSWAIYALIVKKLTQKYSGFTITYYATLFGVVLLIFFVQSEDYISQIKSISLTSVYAIMYMGMAASGIGYLCYNLSIEKIGPTKTASFVYSFVPIFVAILANCFFSEPVTPVMIVSAVLVLLGLHLMLREKRNK